MSEKIIMPAELTAENGAKKLLIGEFNETVIMQCEECEGEGELNTDYFVRTCSTCSGSGNYALKVPISWSTIKDIYAKCADHFENKLEKEE